MPCLLLDSSPRAYVVALGFDVGNTILTTKGFLIFHETEKNFTITAPWVGLERNMPFSTVVDCCEAKGIA